MGTSRFCWYCDRVTPGSIFCGVCGADKTLESTNGGDNLSEIPLAPVKRIMNANGANRVSDDANERLRNAAEEFTEEIADEAARNAKHAGRKTVQREDVTRALDTLRF